MSVFDPNVFDPNVFDAQAPAVAIPIPTVVVKVLPPVMIRGMREFQGGSTFGSGTRKVYISSAPPKRKPFLP